MFMNEYLSYFAAASIWNIPYIEAIPGPEITKTTSADRTVPNAKQLTFAQSIDGSIFHKPHYNIMHFQQGCLKVYGCQPP